VNRFSDTLTEERAVAALSRLVSLFVFKGKVGAKVIDRHGITRACKLSPDVESELQDAIVLLKAHGRHFE
jgi:hypothetical protein